ncbi:MAG: diguanylate cyclase, partial [Mycobacteriales bacterium]
MPSGPTIGVLSPLVDGFYFGGILSGITSAARAAGGSVLAVQTFDAGVEQTDAATAPYLSRLPGGDHVDGYIVVINAVRAGFLRESAAAGKPVILISNQTPGLGCPVVVPDNYSGVREAIDHLVAHGHSRIAFVGHLAQTDMQERYQAYLAALAAHGLDADPALLYESDENERRGGERAAEAMVAAGLPSTAAFVATDLTAVGVIDALCRNGVSLPSRQAIIGFDDAHAAKFTQPRLTTMRQDFTLVGRTAGELVISSLAGNVVEPTVYRVPTSLVRRESCGCEPTSTVDGRATHADSHAGTRSALVIASVLDQAKPAETEATIAALFSAQPDSDTVEDVIAGVREYAARAAAAGAQTAAALATVEDALSALAHAQMRASFEDARDSRESLLTQYTVSMALLGIDAGDARKLHWLARTDASAGSLGLWTSDHEALYLTGSYGPDTATGSVGDVVPLEQFPPRALLQSSRDVGNAIAFALPVRTDESDWGWLAIVAPIEMKDLTGGQTINQWAALLTVALDVAANAERIDQLSREMAVILESSPDAVIRYDTALRYRYLNATAAERLGEKAARVIGKQDDELGRDPRVVELWCGALKQAVARVATSEVEFAETHDGEERWYQARMVPLRGPDGLLTGVLASSRDITVLKRAEHDLAHRAVHDPLTGLANRVLFLDRLAQAVTQLERRPGSIAVLFIDLDHFKQVNDTYGHAAGDRLLVEVAARLTKASRRADTVARLGGDEFALLCDRLAEGEDVRIIGERLVRTLAAPFYEGGDELTVSASIGIVVNDDPYADVSLMIRTADEAMYTAKERGRGRFHVFDEALRERATARHDLEVDLRQAIERREFRLVYQPLFALLSTDLISVEALIRWDHPTRGELQPADFIAVAEQRGLLVLVGEWVLDEALRQLAEWASDPKLESLTMAVNLSARQLSDPGMCDIVAAALERHAVRPDKLTLEITETALTDAGAGCDALLAGFKARGLTLTLDDFGTGHGSLSSLKR